MTTLLSILGALFGGYFVGYFKFGFDAEKSRFDFRVKILREVWEDVLFAKSLACNLDPSLEWYASQGETREERIKRRWEDDAESGEKGYGSALVKARRTVRFNAPFYPAHLHDLAKEVVDKSESLSRFVSSTSTPDLGYWDQVERKTSELNSLVNELSEGIREEVNRPAVWFLFGKTRSKSPSSPEVSQPPPSQTS